MQHRLALALTIGALLWTGILVIAPMALHRPALAAAAASVYAGSAGICHQRPERSFHLAGGQLPVCARCFGLYLAGAAGALLAWGSRKPHARARVGLALAALPTALTWTTEIAGFATFSNATRALAALPLGVMAGWLFVQMLRYDDAPLNGHQVNDGRSGARSG